MRALVVTKHGGPEVLAVKEMPNPKRRAGEIIIKVEASGLNFADLMARRGLYPDAPKPPCVLGYEVAGEIIESDDAAFGVGMRVMAMTRFAGHAEYVSVKGRQVVPMPQGMSFVEAAAIPVNYLTAYHMLFNLGNLRPGAHVLVHMAAGGVGTAAIQLCRTVPDVTIIGTASRAKHDFIKSIGCHHAIDYHTKDYVLETKKITSGQGVHLVLDPLGGEDWKKGFALLRPTGLLMAFGFANLAQGPRRNIVNILKQLWQVPKMSPLAMMKENKGVIGVNLGHLWQEYQLLNKSLIHISDLYAQKFLKPVVHGVFSFDQAKQAFLAIESRQNIGKIIFQP